MDGLNLGGIHGDAGRGDDVAKVGHGVHPDGALRALHEQTVLVEELEYDAEVPEMVCPSGAVD